MRRPLALLLVPAISAAAPRAAADVDGAALVRLLGPHAQAAFAPRGAQGIGALVKLPPGTRASDVGLVEAAPGIARLDGPPARLLAFADAHPDLRLEVTPPLRTLLDTAARYVEATAAGARGLDGAGAVVGVADTGLDVTHPDFLDASGHTRVAWLLDLSVPPIGKHPDLEQKFGTTDGMGHVTFGAVWSRDDIDALLSKGDLKDLPRDEVGHGTLVTSCAAGNGEQGRSPYRGIAPEATLVAARITSAGGDTIDDGSLLQGVGFIFDRADAMGLPVVANLSIGSDFGPHDGSMAWEQALASYVGAAHPGHALVAAAGNSGSIADTPIHQQVYVSPGATTRVPIASGGAQDGGIEVWVGMHPGAKLGVGLDGPDGAWIAPVPAGQSGGKNASDYAAAVYNGSAPTNSPVPSGSQGAVVIWQGRWPAGVHAITLSGSGTADLWAEGTGDQASAGQVGFEQGVREDTINLPATHPAIIGVGCTIDKTQWEDIARVKLGLAVPLLEPPGGTVAPGGATRDAVPGEPCWFSSAGPTITGVQKPEIMAPGAAIVGAMSSQAVPPAPLSIFTNPQCPAADGGAPDAYCQQVDAAHAVSFGTSFSAPIVAGAVAVMLQHDPTLTQDEVLAALQGGAHPLRGAAPFEDQSGVGEVDVLGSVEAVDRERDPATALPVRSASWLTLGADLMLADGSTPLEAIVELRAAPQGEGPAPVADGFGEGRLGVYALVGGAPQDGAVQSLVRRGPGVWVATVRVPSGLGGRQLTVGATFDGADVVEPRTIPIATDTWTGDYASSASGGCAVGRGDGKGRWVAVGVGIAIGVGRRRRRSRVNGGSAVPRGAAARRAPGGPCGRARRA